MQVILSYQRLLQYINSTKDLGLNYYGRSNPTLNAYVDSSLGEDKNSGKSTTGFVINLGTCPIFWNSHLGESGVSISTADAEYMAASSCARQTMACRNLADETEIIDISDPIVIYEDNSACLAMALQSSSKQRNKYIPIKIHYIREAQATGYITLTKIDTSIQTADILTKPLSFPLFSQHSQTLLHGHNGQIPGPASTTRRDIKRQQKMNKTSAM